MVKLNENSLTEQPLIEWLRAFGYDYEFGPDVSPGGKGLEERNSFKEVVLVGRLKEAMRKINPQLNEAVFDDAIETLIKFEHPSLEIANHEIHRILREGIKVEVKDENGERRGEIVKIIDFKNHLNNNFLVTNQFTVEGYESVKRPDVVIFVNGIPLAIFELKNPASTSEKANLRSAYDQLIKDYKQSIPEIFKYNQILVISDLLDACHGTITSPWEWFSAWKGIESENEDSRKITRRLEVLTKGIFQKTHLLDIIENFIIFESDKDEESAKVVKKMCLYHQYFGVNKAVQETLRATASDGDHKIGVFWHTQGSGKSLSMVFYVNKAKKLAELENPTFVFLTDRNDLDDQLYKTFKRSSHPYAQRAKSIQDLKQKLAAPTGGIIFTTIQKFFEDKNKKYPLISERKNIIVIADEAHRSEYAKLAGNIRYALPNASFMGITGTPISLHNRDTQFVFGNYISKYQINRAVEDGATVPIYYEGRLVPLHLANKFIDEELEDLMGEQEFVVQESTKRKLARLEQAVGAKDRLEKISQDITEHFKHRGLKGKAMVVTISRKVAVEMYKLISQIPSAPEAAVVISNPEQYRGEIQKELDAKELEKRFKDPDDPLEMVIVCDMWLTGFDVPHLHTMYIDKPLKNHTLMQAIARVNRVFKDKQGGLVVDYIGIADDLKKSLSIYSSDVQKEALIPLQDAINGMLEKYDIVKSFFAGIDYQNWKQVSSIQLGKLFAETMDLILADEDKKKRFLDEATKLSMLFALVSPHKEANEIRNDVEFFQAIKRGIIKRTITNIDRIDEKIDSAAKELVSKSIAADGIINIFKMQGKDKPQISIFDDRFLEEVKNLKYKNLAIQILRKLLNDELRLKNKNNLIRYRSLLDMLEKIIEEYKNNLLNSAKTIEKLVKLAKEAQKVASEAKNIGLEDDELAFYDVLTTKDSDNEKIKIIARDIVQKIKEELTIDWVGNEIIESRVKSGINRLFLRNGITDQKTIDLAYEQAQYLYRDYVPEISNK